LYRPLNIQEFRRITRRYWVWIASALVVCVGTAVAATYTQTPKYSASARLFVASSESTAPGGAVAGSELAQRVQSYPGLVESPRVLSPVAARLGISEAQVRSEVSASVEPNTVLIDVTAEDTSARRSQLIANAVSAQLVRVIEELETPTSGAAPVTVTLVSSATLPSAPVSPKPVVNLTIGVLVGIGLGFGLALWRSRQDSSIRNVEESEGEVSLPTLASIPTESGDVQNLVTGGSPRSPGAEAYRQLRTNLRAAAGGDGIRSLLVTSAVGGEGKTTTACGLAIAMAHANLKVALVEADMRRPSFGRYLHLESGPGLADVLSGDATLEAACREWSTDRKTILVITAGSMTTNPSELLDTDRMQAVIDSLEQWVDVVIMDAPPVLPVTDASVIAAMVGAVVVVVAAERTGRDEVRRGIRSLGTVKANVIGVVLNMVSSTESYTVTYGGLRAD
jgi:succinoglycan biosynthesis transport protein ExoP